jgi:Lhr-like helicase
MSLPDLTPESVRQAIVEFDRVGRDSFLRVRHYPRCRRGGFCDMSAEVWDQVYRRLADLVGEHRTTLIFVNTRRMAERATRKLSALLGEENVAAHHGSLAKAQGAKARRRAAAQAWQAQGPGRHRLARTRHRYRRR